MVHDDGLTVCLPSVNKGQCARRRLKWPHAAFSSSAGGSPPSLCGLACNHFLLPPGPESFSGGKRAPAPPTRRPGFVPAGEENTAGRPFRREKPRFPLFTESNPIQSILTARAARATGLRQKRPRFSKPYWFRKPGALSFVRDTSISGAVLLPHSAQFHPTARKKNGTQPSCVPFQNRSGILTEY